MAKRVRGPIQSGRDHVSRIGSGAPVGMSQRRFARLKDRLLTYTVARLPAWRYLYMHVR